MEPSFKLTSLLAVLLPLALAGSFLEAQEPSETSATVEQWQIDGALAAIEDSYAEVRASGLSKLVDLRPNPNAALAQRIFQILDTGKPDEIARYAAVKLLGIVGGQGDQALFRRIMADDSEEFLTKSMASEALVELTRRVGGKEGIESLIKEFPMDPEIQPAAAAAYVSFSTVGGLPAVLQLLPSSNFYIEFEVAKAIPIVAKQSDLATLRKLTQRRDVSTARNALLARARLEDDSLLPDARKIADDQFAKTDDPLLLATSLSVLGERGDETDLSRFRSGLKHADSQVRRRSAYAIGLRGGPTDIADVRAFLDDEDDDDLEDTAAEAIVAIAARQDEATLLDLIRDDNFRIQRSTSRVFAETLRQDRQRARAELKESNQYRVAAAAMALGDVGNQEDVALMLSRLSEVRGGIQDIQIILSIEQSLEKLRPHNIGGVLAVAYVMSDRIQEARWIAHYAGGGDPEKEILCAYLGRPKTEPKLPTTKDEAVLVLEVLSECWDLNDSAGIREDIAKWTTRIIANFAAQWTSQDVELLTNHKGRLENDSRVTNFVPQIDKILAPLRIEPSPHVRSVIALLVVTFLAGVLFVVRPGRLDIERWLPLAGYAGGGIATFLLNTAAQLQLNVALFVGLLIVEVAVDCGYALLSARFLRVVAGVEPFRAVVIPIALRFSRRSVFADYVRAVRNRLDAEREASQHETYMAIPATRIVPGLDVPEFDAMPADTACDSVTGIAGEASHVLIRAEGGRGKSALLRQIVSLALNRFDANPNVPLPIILERSTTNILTDAERSLQNHCLSVESFHRELSDGRFFLVVDGMSESSIGLEHLRDHMHSRFGRSPMLISSRPWNELRLLLQSTARWCLLQPHRLTDENVDAFADNYNKPTLQEPLRSVCRDRYGTYQPNLVRFALTVEDARVHSIADLYERVFQQLFVAKGIDHIGRLEQALTLCRETYWRNGIRTLNNPRDDASIEDQLLRAGVLVPADDRDPPRELRFVHDSMQSYLSAKALSQDEDRYEQLFRAATAPEFSRTASDLTTSGMSELFEMCLETYRPLAELRDMLEARILAWRDEYAEDIRKRDVVRSVPEVFREELLRVRNSERVITRAVELCATADNNSQAVVNLGYLYSEMAKLVYGLQ